MAREQFNLFYIKGQGSLPVLILFHPDFISIFKAKGVNRENWVEKQYLETQVIYFPWFRYAWVKTQVAQRRQKDKTLKVALNHSICIGYVDLYKDIHLSVHRKTFPQNPIRFCLTDIPLYMHFCLQVQNHLFFKRK